MGKHQKKKMLSGKQKRKVLSTKAKSQLRRNIRDNRLNKPAHYFSCPGRFPFGKCNCGAG